MARSIDEVCDLICDAGIVPVFSHPEFMVNCKVIEACFEAGFRIFEFTNRVDDAPALFARLRKFTADKYPAMLFGAGTIRRRKAAKLFCEAGAEFVVGPNFHKRIVKVCLRAGVSYSPGCFSPSELERAQEALGPRAVLKIFPGSELSPKFVKSVLATNSSLRLMITGGVEATRDSLSEWFDAGARAVGIGSELIPKPLIESGDWGKLQTLLSDAKLLCDELRKPK